MQGSDQIYVVISGIRVLPYIEDETFNGNILKVRERLPKHGKDIYWQRYLLAKIFLR